MHFHYDIRKKIITLPPRRTSDKNSLDDCVNQGSVYPSAGEDGGVDGEGLMWMWFYFSVFMAKMMIVLADVVLLK